MRQNRALLLTCLLGFALAAVARAEADQRWSEVELRGLFDPPETESETTTENTATDTHTETTEETTATTPTTTPSTPTSQTTETTPTTKPGDETTGTTTADGTTKPGDTTQTTPTGTSNTSTGVPTSNASVGPPTTTHIVSTDDSGGVVTMFTTYTPTPSNPDSQASQSSENSENGDDEDSGLSTGSIIGMSVAGGVALIGAICFIIWKFTRKNQDEFDDTEAIKWPELNAHSGASDSAPLGGGYGADLTRQNSAGTTGGRSYAGASNYSTAELSAADPYAVPPLPHMNPNQPYRDDPNAMASYYDPYRGPVPQFGAGPESIPMTQMAYGDMRVASPAIRTASPAPPMAPYGLGAADQLSRGGSPAPNMYGAPSPGPQAAYDPVTYSHMR